MSAREGAAGRRAMSLAEAQIALEEAQEEAAELRDRTLRIERDAAAQLTDRIRAFSVRLLEVADNLERALAHASSTDPLQTGVQATLDQLRGVLRLEGVTVLPVEPGAPFDPRYHEALGGQPADVAQDTVVEVVQSGYLLNDQILRPARVIVATPRPST